MQKWFIAIVGTFLISGCGVTGTDYPVDVPTQAPPTIARVEPTSGPVGTTITIYGFGFSVAAPTNVVIIGNSATIATDYQLLDNASATEIESLTATVPNDTELGEQAVVVVVYENASNADVTFEVTP